MKATRHRAAVLSLSAAATVSTAACNRATRTHDGPLQITGAWSRAVDSGATGVVYGNVRNVADAPITITALSSADAELADLHETVQMSGMVHMTARPSVTIPPDSTLVLRAGGLHVMLTGVRRTLRVNDSVSLALTLQDGRLTTIRVPVREP